MNKKDIYNNYISRLEKALHEDNFDDIDYILEFLYTTGINEKYLSEIDDILRESTLYTELKEKEYKDEALRLIEEFKK